MNNPEFENYLERIRLTHPNFNNEEYVATRVMAPLGGRGKRGLHIFDAAKEAGILGGDEESRWDKARPLLKWLLKNTRSVRDPEVVVAQTVVKDEKSCLKYLEKDVPGFYPSMATSTLCNDVQAPSVFFRFVSGDVRVFTNVDGNSAGFLLGAAPANIRRVPQACPQHNLLTMIQDVDVFMDWLQHEKLSERLFL